MVFTLMDTHTGNIVGSHATRDAALRVVAETVQRYGDDGVATLALGQFEAGRLGQLIAEGPELVQMAMSIRPAARKSAAAEPENAARSHLAPKPHVERAKASSAAASASSVSGPKEASGTRQGARRSALGSRRSSAVSTEL